MDINKLGVTFASGGGYSFFVKTPAVLGANIQFSNNFHNFKNKNTQYAIRTIIVVKLYSVVNSGKFSAVNNLLKKIGSMLDYSQKVL